ncbi:cleavage stimulating factor 64-like isoform X2 [Aristolochia californica]|uniref:cleavage stimulating factor 64-like isoform X2 n=1 Tax=Aristolochia californica TaxID=171875 RepID=UPI0035D9F781
MAGKQIAGDNLTSHLAGMSKNQLYDVMSQMKALIEQNQQQARQILVENPLLTKALFQAQIMLGMVQLPQVMPNIQQTLSQASQQPPPVQPCQPLIVPPTQSLPGQSVLAGQSGSSQLQYPSRQQSSQSFPFTSATAPPLTLPSQTGPQHFKAQLGAQISSTSLPQPSLSHHPPAAPHHSASPPSSVPQPSISSQSQQQTLQAPGIHHQPLKPPMLPQPRPSSLQPFSHQMHSQIGPSAGFQPPQQLMSQPMFHVSTLKLVLVHPSRGNHLCSVNYHLNSSLRWVGVGEQSTAVTKEQLQCKWIEELLGCLVQWRVQLVEHIYQVHRWFKPRWPLVPGLLGLHS